MYLLQQINGIVNVSFYLEWGGGGGGRLENLLLVITTVKHIVVTPLHSHRLSRQLSPAHLQKKQLHVFYCCIIQVMHKTIMAKVETEGVGEKEIAFGNCK